MMKSVVCYEYEYFCERWFESNQGVFSMHSDIDHDIDHGRV